MPPPDPNRRIDFAQRYPGPGRTMMWIGAHPDDETMMGPLMGRYVLEGDWHAAIVTATGGENGPNHVSDRDARPLPLIRTAEMRACAEHFGAQLIQWDLPDHRGPRAEDVLEAWIARAGGPDLLSAQLTDAITAVAPDFIVTFDPRHGTTCHPAHVAIARLTIECVRRMGEQAPDLWLGTGRVAVSADKRHVGLVAPVADDPALMWWDTARFATERGDPWRYVGDVLRHHASQFKPRRAEMMTGAPAELRGMFFIEVDRSLDLDDPRYASLCGDGGAVPGWLADFGDIVREP